MYEDDKVRRKRNIVSNAVGDALSYCCGLISQNDMQSLFSNDAQVDKFLSDVSGSVIQDHKNLIKIEKQVADTDSVLNATISNVHKVLTKLLAVDDQENSQIYKLQHARARTSLITTQLAQHLHRTTSMIRMTSILDKCRIRHIPLEIVSMASLRWDLHVLNKALKKDGYQLSIPLTNIPKYYQVPIADCTITPKKIILKLSIPIQKSEKITLYELTVTPFKWKDSTCNIQLDSTYVAVSNSKVTPITGIHLHQCQQTDALCYLPHYQPDLIKGTACPEKLFSRATISELNDACSFQCVPNNNVVITKIGHGTFVITNLPAQSFSRCNGTDRALEIPSTGALDYSSLQLYSSDAGTRRVETSVPLPQ